MKPSSLPAVMAKHLKIIANWTQLAKSANSIAEIKAMINAANARQIRRQALRDHGMSTLEWLALKKSEKAQQMLRDGEQIKNVAAATGFAHVPNFSRFFTRGTGMNPTEFVRRARQRRTRAKPTVLPIVNGRRG